MKDDRKNEALNIINTYTNNWKGYDFKDSTWDKPISDGKATTAEIMGHLLNWDKYLISNVIPSVTDEDGMVFPELDTFNRLGYEYARITKKSLLITEFNDTRRDLSSLLVNILENIERPTTANGITNCPHTGKPYSLLYIIEEFIEHDQHHKKQIDRINNKE